jgi:hypothetical protein
VCQVSFQAAVPDVVARPGIEKGTQDRFSETQSTSFQRKRF